MHFEEDGYKFRHEPDIRFHFEDAAWPGVVIEVVGVQELGSELFRDAAGNPSLTVGAISLNLTIIVTFHNYVRKPCHCCS
jgi:hypothetical protein